MIKVTVRLPLRADRERVYPSSSLAGIKRSRRQTSQRPLEFIVMDFNSYEPVVFTGSSNLAAAGEKANGDNLLAIFDRAAATAYAIEAVRLVDHYHFRTSMKAATSDRPLMLKTDD